MIWKFFGLAYVAFLFDIFQDGLRTVFIKYEQGDVKPEVVEVSDTEVIYFILISIFATKCGFSKTISNACTNFKHLLIFFDKFWLQTDEELEEPTGDQLKRSQLKSEGRVEEHLTFEILTFQYRISMF